MRLALAAIVFCSALCAGLGQVPFAIPAAGEPSGTTTIAAAPLDCAPVDDERGWRPPLVTAAAITDSAWKSRTLHAVVAATPRPEALVARDSLNLPLAHAAAPSYLLHTPLLI